MPKETELKLAIEPAQVTRLWRHPLLAALTTRKLRAQHLLSIYYDTADFRLRQERIALRLRLTGKRWIQTIKLGGRAAAGLHERPEWEQLTTADTLQLDDLPDPRLARFFADATLRSALKPAFVTAFARSRRMLQWPGGDVAEFALDRGEVRAGGRTAPFCEIEIELKSGAPVRLFELAAALHQDIPLRLSNISKAERGYRVAMNAPPAAHKAEPEAIPPEATAGEALLQTLGGALAHLQAHEDGLLHGDASELVHQMRVATRRLRAALSVFAALVPEQEFDFLRAELRWLCKALNGARNWDVFAEETLPPLRTALAEGADMEWLAARVERKRREHRIKACQAVASARYQRLLLGLGAWMAAPAWRSAALPAPATMGATALEALPAPPAPSPVAISAPMPAPEPAQIPAQMPVAQFGAAVLRKRHRKLRARGRRLATLAPAERHAVRIAAKKLRYAAQFFASLYAHKPARRYVAALERLQYALGIMNDAATAVSLMREITPAARNSAQQQAKGAVLGWASAVGRENMPAAVKTWKAFAGQKVFWSGDKHRKGAK